MQSCFQSRQEKKTYIDEIKTMAEQMTMKKMKLDQAKDTAKR